MSVFVLGEHVGVPERGFVGCTIIKECPWAWTQQIDSHKIAAPLAAPPEETVCQPVPGYSLN